MNKNKEKNRPRGWPKLRLRPLVSSYDLWRLAALIHPSAYSPKKMRPLSIDDRRTLAKILFRLLGNEDPRIDFFEIVDHRPADIVLSTAKYEAVYEINLDVRFGVPRGAAKEAAMKRWKLTTDQLKHAIRKHQKDMLEYINSMEDADALTEWNYSKTKDPEQVLEDVLSKRNRGPSILTIVEAIQLDMQKHPEFPPPIANKMEAEARRDFLLSLEESIEGRK